MNKKIFVFLFVFVFLCGCGLPVGLVGRGAEAGFGVGVFEDVLVPMRDGAMLSANVFRPGGDGAYPVIVMRTPYGKGDGKNNDGLYFASEGYVYVAADCRGRGPSEGAWYPGVNERNDGYDTHQWILDQEWCNGSIGTTGGSYVGYTQWITAADAGDYLKAMFTVVPLIDWYEDASYIGGAYHHSQMTGWGAWMAKPPEGVERKEWKQEEAFLHLPLSTWDDVLGFEVDYLRDWVGHPEFDDYWGQYRMTDELDEVRAANVTVSGWYDIFVSQAFENIGRIKKESRSAIARENQYMVVGPWTHGLGTKVGEIEFGEVAKFNKRELQTSWFGKWLKGEDGDVDEWAPLRIFVMGINQWRDEYEWPLGRTEFRPYYFHSGGGANSAGGDGSLSTDEPGSETADEYVYDPVNPVATHGGCNLSVPAGAFDQGEIEKRDDVLVYTSDVLDENVEVTGPVKVILYASSSGRDTDWTGKLVDVYADGRAMNICDGVIRARYRDGQGAELIEPGRIYRYEIDLWVTSNVFLKGHKIRVEISSSNFPRIDRNPNTGHAFGSDAEMIKANQKVYHDKPHQSHILLPVIP